MRLFIAVEFTPEIQADLKNIQTVLKRGPSKVKWVSPEHIHLTLRFLGETPDEELGPLKETLNTFCGQQGPFALTLNGLGAFPKVQAPRIIWVGLDKGRENSIQLARKLEGAVSPLGFKREDRAFHPHATLGRVRFIKDRSRLVRTLKSPTLRAHSQGMHVTHLSLIQSVLTPEGPIYTVLTRYPLSGSGAPSP